MIKRYLFNTFLFLPLVVAGQDSSELYHFIHLDSIVIKAEGSPFQISKFIKYLIEDKSFYQAFKNLRTAQYEFTNDIQFYDEQGSVVAGYTSENRQLYNGQHRKMEVANEQVSGNFYNKQGAKNHYTSKLYDRLFYSPMEFPAQLNESQKSKPKVKQEARKMQSYVDELKKLMFSPGEKTSVPWMCDKTNIFDEDMIKYYDYNVKYVQLQNKPAYLFDIQVKPFYHTHQEHKTVIKKLYTWFDPDTKQILKKSYELRYSTLPYNFHILMDVDIDHVKGRYYPSYIHYKGTWKIISKKKEKAEFTVQISNFK